MRCVLFSILLSLTSATANAQCTGVMLIKTLYPTLELAAIAVLAGLVAKGGNAEHGGFIIEIDGKYRHSKPVSQGHTDSVDYCIAYSPEWRVAGVYHTHPEIPLFSKGDMDVARRSAVPSFLATMGTAEGYQVIARFDPDTGVTTMLGTFRVLGPTDVRFSRYE
jgi:proteasome lid subunit RPN8/RPN11